MDPINRQFMVRRLTAVKQRRCYIQIFQLIVEHNVPYTVNDNGVFFNMSTLSEELWKAPKQADSQCVDLTHRNYGGYSQIATCCCFRSSHLLMISSICRTTSSGRCDILIVDAVHIDGVGDTVPYNQLV
ncbi:MAG: hypothetical protein ACKPKO_21220 [Candidatus Fonsibacter sp.]